LILIDTQDWSYGLASNIQRVIQMKRILTAVALAMSMCVASASHADDRFTFEKYPASTVSNKALAKVDWSSNKALAGQWRSKESIEGTVGKKADFAGHCGVAHRQNSNAIFMSDLRYYKDGSPDMMQNDGVVLWNEKAKKFELVAKSKPFLVKMD